MKYVISPSLRPKVTEILGKKLNWKNKSKEILMYQHGLGLLNKGLKQKLDDLGALLKAQRNMVCFTKFISKSFSSYHIK